MKPSAIVPAMLALLTVVASAQAPAPVSSLASGQATRVFRSSASMVALNVTVTDGEKLVTGLRQEDFTVYEDGVPQEVRFFETSAVPMDVILLLDASSSMRSRMPVVHDAAKGFMKLLREGDRGAVISFNDNVRLIQDLTADQAAIESAINSTVPYGSTTLHNAIYIALKQFGRPAQASGQVRRQAIAVLSDGDDTSSLVSFDDVLAVARKTGVNIYTIGLQSEPAPGPRRSGQGFLSKSGYAMKTLAKETGAEAFFPSNVFELKNVYAAIANELEAQYSIAYAPSNTRQDGGFRRIVVRVTSNPEFRSRARAGYTAERVRASAGLLRQLR